MWVEFWMWFYIRLYLFIHSLYWFGCCKHAEQIFSGVSRSTVRYGQVWPRPSTWEEPFVRVFSGSPPSVQRSEALDSFSLPLMNVTECPMPSIYCVWICVCASTGFLIYCMFHSSNEQWLKVTLQASPSSWK
jgi:hypothetical protein